MSHEYREKSSHTTQTNEKSSHTTQTNEKISQTWEDFSNMRRFLIGTLQAINVSLFRHRQANKTTAWDCLSTHLMRSWNEGLSLLAIVALVKTVDRGEPHWEGSAAKAFLREDMEQGKHKTMRPRVLYESREQYEMYELKVFRDKIYQVPSRADEKVCCGLWATKSTVAVRWTILYTVF